MSELYCPSRSPCDWEELLQVPEDTSLPRFMLDSYHPLKPQQGTPCLVEAHTGRKISINELRSRTAALASALYTQYSIGEGDVVMICSPNHVDYPIIVWAVHSLGGIVTLSNPQYTKHELLQQARLTRATLLILHSSVLDAISSDIAHLGVPSSRIISLGKRDRLWNYTIEGLIERAEHRKNPVDHSVSVGGDRVALLALSSGTTGAPKAVKLSHRGLIVNILQMAAHIKRSGNKGFSPGDVALQTLPFFHVAGFVLGLHLCLFLRMSVVVTEQYDFIRMLEDIVRFNVTTLVIVPPQAISLCKHPATNYFALNSLKKIFIGAAPVSAELQRSVATAIPNAQVGQLYGLTEASCTLTMTHGSYSSPGSVGQLLPGTEAQVVKLDGTLAGFGERGELYIKTPSVALGYLDNIEATNETFRNDNWIRTGDEVLITKNNEIFVFDRVKDVLKVRGFQVTPAELEGHLLEHSDVLDAAVIGIPHSYNGQVPFAFIVLRETAEQLINGEEYDYDGAVVLKTDILKYVSDRTAPYKRISGLEFVKSIPKTSSGKVLRRTLRKSWEKSKAKL